MLINKEKALFLSPIIENNVFYYAIHKINTICKISTFFEDLSFLNARSSINIHLNNQKKIPNQKNQY